MKNYYKITSFFILCLFCIVCSEKPNKKPNIIFILVDDLGIHQIGAYGSAFYETPTIDQLAEEGMKFTNAYAAAPVCSPTRASIMTGKYPAHLKLTDFIPGKSDSNRKLLVPEWKKYLSEKELTIAENLKLSGYTTGHFGKWHLNIDKKYKKGRAGDPGSQGFDIVHTTHKPGAGPPSLYENDNHHVKEITENVLKFIEDNKHHPFFAYVAHNTIHSPEVEEEILIERYRSKGNARVGGIYNPIQGAMLETLDISIYQILMKLKELNLENNTVIIFFSDNGQLADKNNKIFKGSKGDLYEGGIHMPLIIRWPEMIDPGTRCNELVISNDFYNTIIDIASSNNEVKYSSHSVSILPYLLNEEISKKERVLYWHYPHYHGNGLGPQGAVRKGKFKLIEWYEKSYFNESGMYELYNLEKDPGELHNLANILPEKVRELASYLDLWRDTIGAQEMIVNEMYLH